MHRRFPAAGRFLEALHSIRRDLAHAVRSLFKERTFTLVCVASLGIGMGAFVALVTFNRAVGAPARGINTDGLTELLVLPVGPLRARAGVWALERWSYPDYQALRDAETGMGVTGWTREFSQFGTADPGPVEGASSRGHALRLGQLLPHIWGVARSRIGFRPRHRRQAIGRAARCPEPRLLAEPRRVRPRHRREVRDDRWRSACRGRDHAGRLSRPLPYLSSAGLRALHSAGAAPASPGESESSIRQDGRLGAHPRPAQFRSRPRAGECAGIGDGLRPGAALSGNERIQGGDGRTVPTRRGLPVVRSREACSASCSAWQERFS